MKHIAAMLGALLAMDAIKQQQPQSGRPVRSSLGVFTEDEIRAKEKARDKRREKRRAARKSKRRNR